MRIAITIPFILNLFILFIYIGWYYNYKHNQEIKRKLMAQNEDISMENVAI